MGRTYCCLLNWIRRRKRLLAYSLLVGFPTAVGLQLAQSVSSPLLKIGVTGEILDWGNCQLENALNKGCRSGTSADPPVEDTPPSQLSPESVAAANQPVIWLCAMPIWIPYSGKSTKARQIGEAPLLTTQARPSQQHPLCQTRKKITQYYELIS
ncbi:TPA: hypothetical protein ACH3X2_002682 [Trebouxia sp. C0005]